MRVIHSGFALCKHCYAAAAAVSTVVVVAAAVAAVAAAVVRTWADQTERAWLDAVL